MITALSPSSAGGHDDRSSVNIAQQHVYSVLGAFEVVDQGVTKRLFRVRNPWGTESYTGAYSDADASSWNPTLKAAVGYVNANDGTFFIDPESYFREFETTVVAYDTAPL